MDKIETEFIRHVKRNELFNSSDRVLLAISGGSDSMALLQLMLHLPHDLRPQLAVATVDFALRPESKQEVELVRKYCNLNQVQFFSTVWQHPEEQGMESKARKFRYQYFKKLMQQKRLNKLVTAHQADDQSETMLMKLIRSGSFWEMSGINLVRPFAGNKQLVRPLLMFTKEDLIAYLKRQKIEYAVDQTNFDNATLRNRLRNHIIPELSHENRQFTMHVSNFSEQMQAMQGIIEQAFSNLGKTAAFKHVTNWQIDLDKITHLSVRQQALFIQYIVHQKFDFEISQQKIKEIIQILNNKTANAQLDLGENLTLTKTYQVLTIGDKKIQLHNFQSQVVKLNQAFLINEKHYKIQKTAKRGPKYFYFDHAPKEILLRKRRPGDRVRLLDGHHQKLKDRLINLKIPQDKRNNLWLVTFDEQIVWIPDIYFYQSQPTDYLYEIITGD